MIHAEILLTDFLNLFYLDLENYKDKRLSDSKSHNHIFFVFS